jgi:hypothetical protein
MTEIVHLQLRVASRGMDRLKWKLAHLLSLRFRVLETNSISDRGVRLKIDAITKSSNAPGIAANLVPRVEIVLRPDWGDTVQALVCYRAGPARARCQVKRHADDVSEALLVALAGTDGDDGGFDGHWISPCGWYLAIHDGSFRSERHFVDPGCDCGGSWREISSGLQHQDASRCRLQPLLRSTAWQASVTLVAGHSNDRRCRLGPRAHECAPPSELDRADVALSRSGKLVVSTLGKLFVFRRLP